MLIYDHNKEFIGIDEDDLRLFGYASAGELFSDCNDIADLFVKKPGYIHNFKNFQWIDFILHAEAETSKAVIQAKTRSFSCDITIKPFFLTSTPDQEAYSIFLQHVKPLDASTEAAIAQAPLAQPEPPQPTVTVKAPTTVTPETGAMELPNFDDVAMTTLSEPDTLDIPLTDEVTYDPYAETKELLPDFNAPLDIEEDLFLTEDKEPVQLYDDTPEAVNIPVVTAPTVNAVAELEEVVSIDEEAFLQNLQVPGTYEFDPHVAADELGLPVDLIEEFIGDFIQQSYDFHDELFEAAAKSDFENVKILSHKLKGVAANLRIEDAFEVLSIVNNSHDLIEVEASLKRFYQIINKLDGKEEVQLATKSEEPQQTVEETLPPMPTDTEEELYAFDLSQSRTAAELSQEIPKEEENTDGLYNFDIIKETTPSVAPTEDEISEEMYNFDIAEEPTAAPAEAETSDEMYNFDVTEEPVAALTEAEISEEIYSFDTMEEETAVTTPTENEVSDEMYNVDITEEPTPLENTSADLEQPVDEPEDTTEETVTEKPERLHYDAHHAANELGLRLEIIQELQHDFVVDTQTHKSELEEAIALFNNQQWQTYASQLKGVTDNLRMHELSTILEVLTHTEDAQKAKEAVHQLYSYIDQL